MENLIELQYGFEQQAIGIGIDNYNRTREKADKRSASTDMAPENYLLRKSLVTVSESIVDTIMTHQRGDTNYQYMLSILRKLHPDVLAFLTLQVCLNTVGKQQSLATLAETVGTRVRHSIDYMTFKKEMPGYLKAVEKTMDSKNSKYKATVLGLVQDKKGIPREKWTNQRETSIRVGTFLIYRLIESVQLFELSKERKAKDKITTVVRALPGTIQWIEKAHQDCAAMSPQYLPMVIPPQDWESMYGGGFLSPAGPYRIPAVRMRHVEPSDEMFDDADMSLVYRCLNGLQKTPYRINERVLEIMKEGAKYGIGGLPEPDIEASLEAPLWNNQEEFERIQQEEPDRLKKWKISRKLAYDAWHRHMSQRRTLHWQLFLSEKFKAFEQIFFCWNMDWRGRVYPIQQYINPQADSNGKALIEFAKGKVLGRDGGRWLAIHGANTFGVDKVPFSDRVKWVKTNQDKILDSAMNPMDGARFWCEADSPYMFLAFCFEWADMCELEREGKGEAFVSHIPVGMDGSCSGLQHYSALLKDEIGGQYVNLVPTERPSDIYAAVATEAEKIVAKDVESEFAAMWHGKIDRGITKRNTMTWAYSATLHGFANQLEEELTKRDEDERIKGQSKGYLGEDSNQVNGPAAMYLAKTNLQAIGKVVVKAVEAMDYLKEVAKVAAQAGVTPTWVTPSGMKVVHRYNKAETRNVNTLFGNVRIRVGIHEETNNTDSRKQASSIAPNFIHSLDASHLILTTNICMDEGITDFAMIHDSFGCHASDIPTMNRILREEFIRMYSTENGKPGILEDFHEQVAQQLPQDAREKLPKPPTMGYLDLTQITKSLYFFA